MSIKYGIERLPSEYQEVEYIQSSGTQYIDTLITPTISTKSQIKFVNLEYTGYVIYGFYAGDDSKDYRIFNENSNYKTYFDIGSNRLIGENNTTKSNVLYELEIGNNYVKDLGTGDNIVNGTAVSSFTANGTITLNGSSNMSKNKWYYVKIREGDDLQRNFVPCYRKSDDVIGMYDLVNNVFYTNAGSGTFTKGNDIILKDLQERYVYMSKRLPDEYQEVEYIQTTGTQFINIGLFAYNSYQVETKVEVTNTNQEYPVFGCYGANNVHTYYHLTCYQNKWYFGLNGSESNGGTYSPVIGTQYEIVYNNSNSQLNVNGTDVASTSGTVGASGTTLGIAIRGNGQYYGQYKYFYFKIYDKVNEEYVRNFVPCYRKSDDVIGMYDLVNNQFYTNSGTGTFTKGNDQDTPGLRNVTAVYVGNGDSTATRIRPFLPYETTANTLVYWRLNGDMNDYSGNNRHGTGNITYEQFGDIQVGKFNGGQYVYRDDGAFDIYGSQNYTYSMRVKVTQFGSRRYSFGICENNNYGTQDKAIDIYPTGYASGYIYQNAEKRANSSAGSIQLNKRYNLITTFDGSTLKLYINGQLAGTVSTTSSYNFSNPRLVLSRYVNNDCDYFYGYVSEFIFENIAWTEQKITKYINDYKCFYGVS